MALQTQFSEEFERFRRELQALVEVHALWRNPLLERIRAGDLTEAQWAFLCGHHLRYSVHFTRFLAALIAQVPPTAARRGLVDNFIEEEGSGDPEKAHARLLERFIVGRFGAAALSPLDAHLSQELAFNYLQMANGSASVGTAVLAFACEAVAPRLYQSFVDGMRACGFNDEELHFFLLHIGCDDGHALQLQQLLEVLLLEDPLSASACRDAVISALDARDAYFTALSARLQQADTEVSLAQLVARPCSLPDGEPHSTTLGAEHSALYHNVDRDAGVDFAVSRFQLPTSILDPRLLTVPANGATERHAHAHETLFVVLQGVGKVRVGSSEVEVSSSHLVYVPRWVEHQTVNTGDADLSILAITDYGLTRRFDNNTETSYRKRPDLVGEEIPAPRVRELEPSA